MQQPAADVILLSDDSLFARTVQLALADRGTLALAPDVGHAERLLRGARGVRAIIVDAKAAPRALAEVARLRAVSPIVPMLVVASKLTSDLLNGLQPLRVQILVRPLPSDGISVFLERALVAGRLEDAALRSWIEHYADELRLTPNDVALFPLVLDEEQREDACARLGIDEEQLERGLRRLVKKCRVRNTDRLARNLLRDAYLFRSEVTAELIDSPRAVSF